MLEVKDKAIKGEANAKFKGEVTSGVVQVLSVT